MARMPNDKPQLRLVKPAQPEASASVRRTRAEAVHAEVQALNDVVLRDMDRVGAQLVQRWRAFRNNWLAWYARTTPTTWWWEASAQLVESYAQELLGLRAEYERALLPRPVPPPMPALAAVDLAQTIPPERHWGPVLLLGAVGLGIWYFNKKPQKEPVLDDKNDFGGIKRVLRRGGKLKEEVDSAQLGDLDFEEVDIGEDDPFEEDEWLEEGEIEDDRGNVLVPGPVPGYYIPKPWSLDPSWLQPPRDEEGAGAEDDEDDDEEDDEPPPPPRRARRR